MKHFSGQKKNGAVIYTITVYAVGAKWNGKLITLLEFPKINLKKPLSMAEAPSGCGGGVL